jgi:hypothetical protein
MSLTMELHDRCLIHADKMEGEGLIRAIGAPSSA